MKNNKRIVFLCSSQPEPTAVRKMDALFESNKFEVFLVYWKREKSLINKPFSTKIKQSNIKSISITDPRGNLIRRAYLNFLFFFKTYRFILKSKPQILHGNNLDMLILCVFYKVFLPKIRLVLDLLDTRDFFTKGIWQKLALIALKKANLIIISSPKYFDGFLKKVHPMLDKNKVVYVPNAPNLKDFKNFKQKENDSFTIGYIGAFRGKEAIQGLCDTVIDLNNKGLKINVFFAGMGKESKLVSDYVNNYEFITNFGPYDYTTQANFLYSNVDLIYSVYEQSFNKKIHLSCRFNDAIVCGVPIIVQNNTYHAELVDEYKVGYHFNFGDWKQFKKILLTAYNSPETLKQIGENCTKNRHLFVFETYKKLVIKKYANV